jgi:xanthine dehydrogenase/oxidase
MNFLKEGDTTPYGQTLEYCYLDRVWRQLLEVSHYEERVAKVKEFNATSRWKKRGIACIPTKYGMSFLTARHLNQVCSTFIIIIIIITFLFLFTVLCFGYCFSLF